MRIRLPDGRMGKSVSLLRARTQRNPDLREGWVEVGVPGVLIHDAARVDVA